MLPWSLRMVWECVIHTNNALHVNSLLKGMYTIGYVGKTTSMRTLYESRYTYKVQHWLCWQNYEYAYSIWIKIYIQGTTLVMLAKLRVCVLYMNQDIHTRDNIGYVGKTTSMRTLYESRYTYKGHHWLCWQNYEYVYSIWIKIYIQGTTLVMLATLLLYEYAYSLWIKIYTQGTTLVMLAELLLWVCLLSLNQDIHTRYNIGNVGRTASMSMLTLILWKFTGARSYANRKDTSLLPASLLWIYFYSHDTLEN